MSELVPVRRIELRYLLVTYLFDERIATVAEMVDALTVQGFGIAGNPAKTVSDALRSEVTLGRVLHIGWGRYAAGFMPRATEHRIDQRVLALRAKVAEVSHRGGHAA